MLWLVCWGNFIVTVWKLVGLLRSSGVNLTSVMVALVVSIFVDLVDFHHGISLSIGLITLNFIVRLSNLALWTSLIGNDRSSVLDGRSNERLILELRVLLTFVDAFLSTNLSESDITPLAGGSGEDSILFLGSLEHGSIVRHSLDHISVSKQSHDGD